MNARQTAQFVANVLKYKIAGIRTPTVVSFLATYRCPHKCSMCGTTAVQTEELPTDATLRIIDGFAAAGMVKMIFTGGEVFVREDFDQLVERCAHHGVSVSVNSSGWHIREHESILKYIDSFHLSLDGPEEINDAVRYKGCYRDVVDAVAFCKSRKMRVGLMCTINRQNVGRLREVAEFAREREVPVSFHIAGDYLLRSTGDNPRQLEKDQLKRAIDEIVALQAENPFIANSPLSLDQFRKDHFARDIRCLAGRLFIRMNPDGTLKGCGWDVWTPKDLNAKDFSPAEALRKVPEMQCDLCLCESRFELNLAVEHLMLAGLRHLLPGGRRKGMRDMW